jgi:acylphosphatase
MKDISRVHIKVFGGVHGVGFRHVASELAKFYSLTGYVKNMSDKSVEIIAEGKKENLRLLALWASRGPDKAEVTKCETILSRATGEFSDFSIL